MAEAPEQRRSRTCLGCKATIVLRLVLCFVLCWLTMGVSPPLDAQTTTTPALHRRIESEAIEERDSVVISHGRTTLPLEASGEYLLGEAGEAVEIDLERNRLSGFVSRLGDRDSDQGTPLTFFFATSSLSGQEMSFTTHRVHGVWFSFSGTIVRGTARSRAEEGYYRLEGRLVKHDAANSTEQMREVSLPLARQYSGG